MALEAVGVLVNIAGDAGSLVSAVGKARDAFKSLTTATTAVAQSSMPAWKVLQAQIETVRHRTNVLKIEEEAHKKTRDALTASIEASKNKMASLSEQMKIEETHLTKKGNLTKAAQAAIASLTKEMEKETQVSQKQETQLAQTNKMLSTYAERIGAAETRTKKLEILQGQVRVPEQQTTLQKWLGAFSAGAGVFNVASSMLGSLGGLFGGKGRPVAGARTKRDEMAFDVMPMDITAVGVAAKAATIPYEAFVRAIAIGTTVANAVTGAFNTLVGIIGNVGSAALKFGEQAALSAGRADELRIVARYMGEQSGYTSAQIDKVTESLRKEGANIETSYSMVTQFTRANLDLTKASDLLTVAQGAAIISGQGTSDVTQQLIYGITTLQPEMLRTAGIIISAEQAWKDYADANKVSAQNLTGTQKQQAFLNAVLKEGTKLMGLYDEAMKLPSKQLRSLTDRLIPDLVTTLGTSLQKAFADVIATVSDFVKWITESAKDTERLGLILQDFGYLTGIITGKIKDAVKSKLDMGKDAFTWGHNLIIQFANGIIDAVASVIDALAYIGNVIAGWLEPGSPPKLLPEIDEWGRSTMLEYMKGWTSVTMSDFNTIASKLESFLKSFLESTFGKKNITPMVVKMREALAQVMSGVGQVSSVSGMFGGAAQAVQNYLSAALSMSAANNALASAQDNAAAASGRLEAAQKRVKIIQDELNKVSAEYDKRLEKLNEQLELLTRKKTEDEEAKQIKALQRVMTRVSSTDEQKKAAQAEIDEINLRKKIRLTEDEKAAALKPIQTRLDAAAQEQLIAQENLDIAQEAVQAAQAQVTAAQKNLEVQTMLLEAQQKNLELLKEQEAAAKGAGGGGAAGKDAVKAALSKMTGTYLPGMQGTPILDKIPTEIKNIMAKVDELKGHWDNLVSVIGKVQDAWDKFWEQPEVQNVTRALKYVWNELISGRNVINAIKVGIKSLMSKEDQEKFDAVTKELEGFGSAAITAAVENISKMGDAFGRLFEAMSGKKGGTEVNPILASFLGILGLIFIELPKVITWVVNLATTFITTSDKVQAALETVRVFIVTTYSIAILNITQKVLDLKKGFDDLKDLLLGAFKTAYESVEKFLRENFNKALETTKGIISSISTFINETLIPAFNTLKDYVLNTLIPLVINPLKEKFSGLWEKAQGVVDAINWVAEHLGILDRKPKDGGYASGGFVQGGKPSLVGERGMEMFVPQSNGFILPNNWINQIIRPAMPASYINTNSGNRTVQNIRNNNLTVNSQVPSQGIVADWSRLTVLGA